MNRLLEILGRAIKVDTANLLWHWLNEVKAYTKDSEPERQQRLDRIIEYIAEPNLALLDKAEQMLRLYLFDHPSCARGRLASATICIHKNQLLDAIEELNSVYMRHPNNTIALYAMGHCYELIGKEAEAIEFYQDCLKFKNYLQLPRQRLAAIYFKNRQFEKTAKEYEMLRDEYPDDISTLLLLGYLYIALHKYDAAIDTFNNAILIHPDNFNVEHTEIDDMIMDERLDEALRCIEEQLQNEPGRADLMLKHAELLARLGAEEEAIEQYHQLLHCYPDFLEANIKLGTQYLMNNRYYLAAKQFNAAVEVNDKVVDAYIGLATAQKLAGRQSEALSILSLAAAIQPNSSLLFAETATLQFRSQISDCASDVYQQDCCELIEDVIAAHRNQIAKQPENSDLYYRLGVLMMGVNRLSEAIKLFTMALDINPTYIRARYKLLLCKFETGRETEALEEMIEQDSLTAETLEIYYKTAMLYCDKIKFASSMINLEQHMKDNFTSNATATNISIVLQNLGLLDKADQLWENLSDTTTSAINANQSFPPDSFGL